MKKIVCLVLAFCLLLCAAGAMAATVNDVSIYSGPGTGWELDTINQILTITAAGKYVIHDWTGQLIYVDPNVSGGITLELHNVTLNNNGYPGLMHYGTGKLKVDLDATSYVSGVEVERTNGEEINVELSGSGTIAGGSQGVALVSEEHLDSGNTCSITAVVSGSLTITGQTGLLAKSVQGYSGDSGAVKVTVGDSVKITGELYQGIDALSDSDSGNSGAVTVTVSGGSVEGQSSGIVAKSNSGNDDVDKSVSVSVSVSVSGGAKVTGKDSDGIHAERDAKTSAEGDMVSVSVDGADVTGGDSGIYMIDQIPEENKSKMSVTVSGGAQITGESEKGVELRYAEDAPQAVTVTLQDNATVQGESGAIESKENCGKVFVNASKPTAFYIDEESQGDYVGQNDVTDNVQVQDAKKLRLGEVLVNDGAGVAGEAEPDAVADLPQTGDDSSLVLWGALLATAGAALMKKRSEA